MKIYTSEINYPESFESNMMKCPRCEDGCSFCQGTGFIKLVPFTCKTDGTNIVNEREMIDIIEGMP